MASNILIVLFLIVNIVCTDAQRRRRPNIRPRPQPSRCLQGVLRLKDRKQANRLIDL